MTAKQLTDSILQMAIEGKLVPQDPNDEPASVLLERIREEKRRLVKEGKLKKKDLEETPISEEEIPFEVPESWEWVKIPYIGISQLGKTKNPHQTSGHSLPYLCSINVYWEGINLSQKKEMLFEESEIDKYTIKKGDLLICEGGDCGRSAIWDKDSTYLYQNALHRVRFFGNINSKYILNCLYLYKTSSQLEKYIKGETIKHLVKGELDSILFPLPPLAEQHRIVQRIEEILHFVKEYGVAYEEASKMDAELPDKLKKSILQEAIMGKLGTQDPNDEPASVLLEQIRDEKKKLVKGGVLKKKDLIETPVEDDEMPFKIPDGWEWCRVDSYTNKVTDFVASGSFATLRQNVKYFKEENYALLVKTKDFQSDFKRDLTFTDKHGYEFLANSNLFGGELILSNVGSIGKIFIVPKLNRKMSLAPNAIMVRLWNEKHRDWLYYLFQSPFGLALLYDISSATAVRKFNKTDFKKLAIPLPPLAEQHRIVRKIEALFAEIDNMTINNTNKNITKETESKE